MWIIIQLVTNSYGGCDPEKKYADIQKVEEEAFYQ